MDPTSIHLGLLHPQSDNRLYLDVLFWLVWECMQVDTLPIHSMSVHATQAQWSLTQRAVSCKCVLYWLSEDQCNTLINIPWSAGSLGALWLSSLPTGYQSGEPRDNRSLYRYPDPVWETFCTRPLFSHRKLTVYYTFSLFHTHIHTRALP